MGRQWPDGGPWIVVHHPMAAARIPDDWAMLCGILAGSYAPGDDGWWDAGYIPFADAGDGGYLLADRRPGHLGQVAEFYNEDGVRFSGWPDSVAALLEATATSLETGEPVAGRYRPLLAGDRLEWDSI